MNTRTDSIEYTEAGTLRLAERDTPGCLYFEDPQHAEEARNAARWVDGEWRRPVPSADPEWDPDYLPDADAITDEDLERVKAELAAVMDRHLAMRLRRCV